MGSIKENLVGKMLDERYLIESVLGVGGIGAVYVARDMRVMGKTVVVKVLFEESYKNEYVVKKFKQEVEALSRVQHPNIVDILDSGTLPDGMPYIVLEFIEGSSLRALVKPEGADLELSAQIVKDVGAALTAAHEKGILHRDLKPENIMLRTLDDGDTQVKVIDFGIAKVKDSTIAPDTVVLATAGTVPYMSPEQLSAGTLSAASDIFSLGVVAYELLTGRKPFTPETPFQLLEMHRAGVKVRPKDLRPSIPETAQDVLLKALAFAPNDRYLRARDFGDDLFEALTGRPAGRTGRLDSRTQSLVNRNQSATPTSTYATSLSQTSQSAYPTAPTPEAGTNPYGHQQPGAPPLHQQQTQLGNVYAQHQSAAPAAAPRRSAKPFVIVGVLLFVFALAGVGGLVAWKLVQDRRAQGGPGGENVSGTNTDRPVNRETPAATTAPASEIAFTYSLMVQMMQNGKEFQAPFKSSGQEIFLNGWQFRLNVSSPKEGYLYLLNEGLNAAGQPALTVLFPTEDAPDAARLAAGQNVQIPSEQWYVFTGQSGNEPEKIWMVWSPRPVRELEAVKGLVKSSSGGEVTDPIQAESLREFLMRHASSKVALEKDAVNKETHVRGSGDLVVSLAELEHR